MKISLLMIHILTINDMFGERIKIYDELMSSKHGILQKMPREIDEQYMLLLETQELMALTLI